MVEVVGAGWQSGALVVARSHRQRARGLHPCSAGRGLLLRTSSVHGFGMREPLGVVSLDGEGRVRRAMLLRPGGFFWDRGAVWVMELPLSRPPPPVGMVLGAVQVEPSHPGRTGYAGIHEEDHREAAR